MADDRRSREGYLLLADISGYTAFLTSTELEHAHEIVHELTTLIRERLVPPMRFVKLEGDAVFCYADGAAFADGERFVEMIEACYVDFSNRLLDMQRATTCRCNACSAIESLGLKFIAHYGTFVVERDGRNEDLAGADVILAHRLLKNTISNGEGPQAYAFFTEACQKRLPAGFTLPVHSETYESFGETRGGVHDLGPVLATMRAERRAYVSSEDADSEAIIDVPVPPAVAWRYCVDPMERLRWACRQFGKDPDESIANADGRTGAGAKFHCGHGPLSGATREFVDWRPFEYFTARTTMTGLGMAGTARRVTETLELTPLGEHGTRIAARVRLTDRGRVAMLTFRVSQHFSGAFLQGASEALLGLIEEDAAVLGFDDENDSVG